MAPLLFILLTLGAGQVSAQSLSIRWGKYLANSVGQSAHVVDGQGNVIVAGDTPSTELPVGGDAFQRSPGGGSDLFIAKFSGAGQLIWATYYGGRGNESFRALRIDAAGNIYVGGTTASADFPRTGLSGVGGILISFDTNGQRRWALAGNGMSEVSALALDGDGNLAACGNSLGGLSLPNVAPGWQSSYGGNTDGFVATFSTTGIARGLTYWGGVAEDYVRACEFDARGNLHAWLLSSNTVTRTRQSAIAGFGASLQGQIYSTGINISTTTCIGSIGALQVTGNTLWATGASCSGLNTTPDAEVRELRPRSVVTTAPFLMRLSTSGNIQYSSYLNPGSSGLISASGSGDALVVMSSGNIGVCGSTLAADLPVTANAIEKTNASTDLASGFLTIFSNAGKVLYGTYLNGLGITKCRSLSEQNGSVVASGTTAAMPNLIRDVPAPSVSAANQSVWILSLQFTAGGGPGFSAAGVTNAASFASGPIAPGEIVTLFAQGAGPSALAGLQLTAERRVATSVGNTRVLFDGTPAPMVYSVSGQVSAIVPYNVAGKTSVGVVVEYEGVQSGVVQVPVAAAAPGLFALAGGTGQVVAVLEGGCCNALSAPARRGEVIVLYATGEGQTTPAGRDGSLAEYTTLAEFPKPLLPVAVSVGGKAGEILYAGAAPGFVAGLMQINLRLAADTPVGDQVPVVLTVGGVSSRSGLTMVVR